MNRSRRKGTAFETLIQRGLSEVLGDGVLRRALSGAKDRGDIAGVRAHGRPVVVECKNCARLDLAGWVTQAQRAAVNDDALAAVVVHKRHGVGRFGAQWVSMTMDDFIAILTGRRPDVPVATMD